MDRRTGRAHSGAQGVATRLRMAVRGLIALLALAMASMAHAAPAIVVAGSCDTFGNALFTITNTGSAMSVPYTWELSQNGVFLTSGPFTLTATGAAGNSTQLSISGLYGTLGVAIKDDGGALVTSASAFCAKRPSVTINQAAGQPDPTTVQPILFAVAFDEAVSGFDASGVVVTGVSGTPAVTVTDSGNHRLFTVAVSGAADGDVVRAQVAQDAAIGADGVGNRASTSSDNTVTYRAPPDIGLAGSCSAGTGDASFSISNGGGAMLVPFTWELLQNGVFLTSGPFTLTGAGAPGSVTQLSISGLFGTLTVVVKDQGGVEVTRENVVCNPLSVTIDQAAGQADPAATAPIRFDVVFSLPVRNFDALDVIVSGIAATPTIAITDSGDHARYTVAIDGMASGETVQATIRPGAAMPVSGSNTNVASTSTDNRVTFYTGPATHPIATAVTPPGSGTVVCTPNPVSHGGMSSCSASPAAGYRFVAFGGDCTGSTCTLANVQADRTVGATFALMTYPVTAVAAPLAGGSVVCTPAVVDHGGTSTCVATANAGYTFAGFGGDCSGATCTLADVQGAKSVTASFTLRTYVMTAVAAPPAGGSVVCTPAVVDHGGTSTCVPTANAGYTFAGFAGDCSGATCTLADVRAPKSVTASFTLRTYVVTAIAAPPAGGSVVCTPSVVDHGGSSTCVATANAGYTFTGFGGDCTGSACTLADVTGPRNVVAQFAPVTAFTGTTATGTGPASASFTGGGPECRFDAAGTAFVDATAVPPVSGARFEHGWFRAKLVGCTPGSTVRIRVQWPTTPAASMLYRKYGPTPASGGQPIFYDASNVSVVGSEVSFDVTDGGSGDDDLAANGTIVDPSGPLVLAASATAVPVANARIVALLAVLLAASAGVTLRRRRGLKRR